MLKAKKAKKKAKPEATNMSRSTNETQGFFIMWNKAKINESGNNKKRASENM
jgi:hypothetical protein